MTDLMTATVLTSYPLGKHLVRIVFEVPDYEPLRVPDECVTLWFEQPDAQAGRNYTVAAFAEGRMTVDFVVHPGGVAGEWAPTARPGETVGLSRPRAWFRPPAGTARVLAAADLTGLPALTRILAECPHPVEAVLELPDEEEFPLVPAGCTPLLGSGNGAAPSRLAEAVVSRAAELEGRGGPGYIWFAGEAAESRAVRKHLRARGWALDRFCTTGYWRQDAERWNAAYEQVGARLDDVYQRLIDEGRSEAEADELYDLELERAGL